MSKDKLKKANEIDKEIKRLEDFLFNAERVWTGKLVKRTSKYIIKSNPDWMYKEAEYELDTETKNKMLDVLRDKLSNLQKQLTEILEG
ncbi:hypothetical protein D3C81_500920 [compost metagenome]